MKKRNDNIRRNFVIALLSTAVAGSVLLCGCNQTGANSSNNNSTSATQTTKSDNSENNSDSSETTKTEASVVEFSQEDTDTSYNNSDSTSITLNGTTATASGDGVEINGSTITITAAGTYVVSGKLTDGNIVINAGKDDTVKLVLNNAEISSSQTSAIYASQCEKTIILLQDGTENSLSDGSSYVSESSSDDSSDTKSPNAALYVQDDLTILGNGSLTVTGNARNGITSKDTLRISGGNITVKAVNNGITGKDNLAVEGGTITVDAGGDGLRSTYSDTDDSEKGHISINNATITVTSGNDGIQAEKNLTINGGTITITSGGGAGETKQTGFGIGQNNSSDTDSESMKGIKAGENLVINGGTITIDSADDSLHCNGDMSINGGTISIKAGDDAVHSDNTLTIKDGVITALQAYEGLEGNIISISGGTLDITSSDDGINCAGGNDQSGFGGMDGNMHFGRMSDTTDTETVTTLSTNTAATAGSTETPSLTISGGTLYINAEGDSLDSNGDMTISGGTIVLNGTTSGGNGIIDHNGGCTVSGGTIIGAGTSDMLEMPDSSSTQSTAVILFDKAQSAGTLVYISDSSGNIIAAISPEKSFSCVVISSPSLKSGESYTVYTGGSSTGDSTHGYYSSAVVSNGTQYCSFTLSDTVTYVNSSGNTSYSGGMSGGMGDMGGMRGNHNQPMM